MQAIDLVYLWCDGNDFGFREKKRQILERLGLNLPEDNVGDVRYVENNELLFSLRSIYNNAPWINHIYIVTDNQTPKWLKPHDKITIIDHTEIIPKNLLPTFNAYVIETYLHQIPGLSEQFLYANDDMFILEPLSPKTFFDENGLPIVRLDRAREQLRIDQVKKNIQSENRTFLTSLQHAWLVFCENNHREIDFDTFDHSIAAYTKSSWKIILNKYPEITKYNICPFRTYKEIHRLLFAYEMTHNMSSKLIYINKPNFVNRFLSFFSHKEIWVSCRQSVAKIERDIRVCNPKTLCVNKIDNTNRFENLFTKIFSNKAPWEAE